MRDTVLLEAFVPLSSWLSISISPYSFCLQKRSCIQGWVNIATAYDTTDTFTVKQPWLSKQVTKSQSSGWFHFEVDIKEITAQSLHRDRKSTRLNSSHT